MRESFDRPTFREALVIAAYVMMAAAHLVSAVTAGDSYANHLAVAVLWFGVAVGCVALLLIPPIRFRSVLPAIGIPVVACWIALQAVWITVP